MPTERKHDEGRGEERTGERKEPTYSALGARGREQRGGSAERETPGLKGREAKEEETRRKEADPAGAPCTRVCPTKTQRRHRRVHPLRHSLSSLVLIIMHYVRGAPTATPSGLDRLICATVAVAAFRRRRRSRRRMHRFGYIHRVYAITRAFP